MRRLFTHIFIASFGLLSSAVWAQEAPKYESPPKVLADFVTAKTTPSAVLNESGSYMALLERSPSPSIAELSQPEVRLAGLRIRTGNSTNLYTRYYQGISVVNTGNAEKVFGANMPVDNPILSTSWVSESQILAAVLRDEGIVPVLIQPDNQQNDILTPDANLRLNMAQSGSPWFLGHDGKLVMRTIPADRGDMPEKPMVPTGPLIQETGGQQAAARTYQDMLSSPYDEELFDFFMTSQLRIMVIEEDGQTSHKAIGKPGIYTSVSFSPNGEYLLVKQISRPYSYLVPYYRFPTRTEVWDLEGNVVRVLHEQPLLEVLPKGYGSAYDGPRSFTWRADAPATVYWAQAQDGGDPSVEVDFRDRWYALAAPFSEEGKAIVDVPYRSGGITWGDGNTAIAYSSWWKNRMSHAMLFSPETGESRELFHYNYQDRYSNPGSPQMQANEYGKYVMKMSYPGPQVYMTGNGASEEGDRPFLRKFNLSSGETEEIFRSQAPHYERVYRLIDENTMLISRESPSQPRNLFMKSLDSGEELALTDFQHPFPDLVDLKKQGVEYERNDGIKLSGDLYLPPGYDKGRDGPLPTFRWADPR
ncbi:MAG: S9 family peptidase, partial [Bacteroidota bacterium]